MAANVRFGSKADVQRRICNDAPTIVPLNRHYTLAAVDSEGRLKTIFQSQHVERGQEDRLDSLTREQKDTAIVISQGPKTMIALLPGCFVQRGSGAEHHVRRWLEAGAR